MENGAYTLHRLARWTLLELPVEEQARIRETLAALTAVPPSQWIPDLARPLPADPSLYLVPVDESRRLIVEAKQGQPPEVQAIVSQETLDFFAAAVRNGK
jgi:hypothetical protein